MPKYEYYAEVFGHEDGEVQAKNKKEAELLAQEEIAMQGLHVIGKITIIKVQDDE